uniref:Uncharacterized protein n=1 Tax=Parascaris univalens TaxID=6257 RepID=A0A915BBS4_PARUN
DMRMYCVASTQTDAIPDSEGRRNVAIQTTKELTAERVNDVLRGGDRELAERVASIVKEKLLAESDHQRALIQLEQRLKDENDIQIRNLREEKLKQLEEIYRTHRQQ